MHGAQQYKAARQVLEGAMKVAEAALHPWHVLIFDARIPLINCCRATDDSVAALQVCYPGAGYCWKGTSNQWLSAGILN